MQMAARWSAALAMSGVLVLALLSTFAWRLRLQEKAIERETLRERLENAASDGRFTDLGAGQGNFKTPTLREIARTAPYMHDGSIATLEQVIDYYDRGGNKNPQLDSEVRPLGLSAEAKRQLVGFLRSLNGSRRF